MPYIEALPVAEVAAGKTLADEVISGLASSVPFAPLTAVDVSAADELSAADLRFVARRLRTSLSVPVVVGAGASPVHLELARAAAFGLVAGPPAVAVDRSLVAVEDVASAWASLAETASTAPMAAVTWGRLLRQTATFRVAEGLAAESAAYSTLLAGPEFARWLATRPPPRPPVPGAARVEREADVLTLTLDRPARRNAVDTATRDALCEGLALLDADPALRAELRAVGPDFSFGGDLHEFGSAPDPATAHLIRLARSVGALIAAHRDRVTAYVHGACYGAGCELPAFAGRVVATEDARFALPEIRLGLIAGAGGSVSVTRRIGRWRAAWMGLSAQRVGASTAFAWGLVDELAG